MSLYMSLFTILIILTTAISLIVCYLTTVRVFAYNRKYELPETKYTKLFKIIRKEHVLIFYLAFCVSHLFYAFWFLITL